jgi:hypothetical protein
LKRLEAVTGPARVVVVFAADCGTGWQLGAPDGPVVTPAQEAAWRNDAAVALIRVTYNSGGQHAN